MIRRPWFGDCWGRYPCFVLLSRLLRRVSRSSPAGETLHCVQGDKSLLLAAPTARSVRSDESVTAGTCTPVRGHVLVLPLAPVC